MGEGCVAMAGTGEEGSGGRHDEGPVACAAWIFRRTEKQHYYARPRQGGHQQQQQQRKNLVVMGRPGSGGATPALEIFDFDPKTASLSSYPLVGFSPPLLLLRFGGPLAPWFLLLLLFSSCGWCWCSRAGGMRD